MGYRSDITIAVPRDNTKFVEEFDKVNNKHHLFERSEKTAYGEPLVVYSAEWVKWYEDYPDVRDYLNVLDLDEDGDIDFVRIGEDSDDTEVNNPNGWLHVNRVVSVGDEESRG